MAKCAGELMHAGLANSIIESKYSVTLPRFIHAKTTANRRILFVLTIYVFVCVRIKELILDGKSFVYEWKWKQSKLKKASCGWFQNHLKLNALRLLFAEAFHLFKSFRAKAHQITFDVSHKRKMTNPFVAKAASKALNSAQNYNHILITKDISIISLVAHFSNE